ncbi:MAG: acyl carrier protein [Clostridia bacterium]|nr:acyl carrier protein [Clostridia bacterium]
MVFEKLRAIICDYLEVDEDEVTMETSFEDLGADEIDMVDIAMSIEDDFCVEITEETLESFVTVGDAVNYLQDN